MQRPKWRHADVLAGLALLSFTVSTDIRVGVTVSATGSQAPLGQPRKNATTLWLSEVGGEKVDVIVLDDAPDTTRAVTNTRKLMSESNVDVIAGSSTMSNMLATIDTAIEGKMSVIPLASSIRLVELMDAKRRWIFRTPHSDSHMTSLIAEHVAAHDMKIIAYIGFVDALGRAFLMEVQRFADLKHIRVTDTERFSPTDSSVTAQMLHLLANKPDVVVIGGSGMPVALSVRALAEYGYTGKIYFNHGIPNNDFVRLYSKDCEGAYAPIGLVMVAAELPDTNPAKWQALDFVCCYEATFGRGSVSIFAVYMGDIGLLLQRAVPVALKRAKPGMPVSHETLRNALEQVHDLPISTGVANISPQDHVGLDQRTRVMAQIRRGQWYLADVVK